jgi:putative ABC transport system substrate-binding protein
MDRRQFVLSLMAALPAWAVAQSRPKRIGILWPGSEKSLREYLLPGIRKALTTAGVIEGRHYEIDVEPAAHGLAAGASRLAARKPDVVLVQGAAATRAMADAAPGIPVVTNVPDPVAAGFAKSLAKPGGNVTGIARAQEPPRKAIEMLARLVPARARVAIVCRDAPADREFAKRVEVVAIETGVNVAVETVPADRMSQAFAGLDPKFTRGAFLVSTVEPDVLASLARDAIRKRLIAAAYDDAGVEAGFLLSVSTRQVEYFERTAAQLARIMNGARPADTAFDTSASADVVLNRATARAIGLTIPADVQMRADRTV